MIDLSSSSRYGASGASLYVSKRSESLAAHALTKLSPTRDTVTIPVTPVAGVRPVQQKRTEAIPTNQPSDTPLPFLREGADPVELSVRSRIQYLTPVGLSKGAGIPDGGAGLEDPTGLSAKEAAPSPREVAEEAECQTCKNRKYQDGSNDPGVSFKSAAHIAPEQAAAAVRGHESEHVRHEQTKAVQEDRSVVSQTVTMHTAICPECGDVYVSGGQTQTTTAANPPPPPGQAAQQAVPLWEAIA